MPSSWSAVGVAPGAPNCGACGAVLNVAYPLLWNAELFDKAGLAMPPPFRVLLVAENSSLFLLLPMRITFSHLRVLVTGENRRKLSPVRNVIGNGATTQCGVGPAEPVEAFHQA